MAKQQTPKSVFAKQLAGMKETWNKTRGEAAKGRVEVPLGRGYICRVKTARLAEYDLKDEDNKSTGEKCLGAFLQFIVLNDDYAGESIPSWPKFVSEDRVEAFQRDLVALGVAIEDVDMDNLETVLAELQRTKPGCKIDIVSGKWENSRFVNIKTGLTEDQLTAMGLNGASESEPEREPTAPEPETVEAPSPAPARRRAAAAPTSAPAPATQVSGKPPGRSKPPNKPAPAPDPDEPEEVIEETVEEEPETVQEEAEIVVGSQVQWQSKGKVKTGVVVKIDDAKGYVVREDGATTQYIIKFDWPSLAIIS